MNLRTYWFIHFPTFKVMKLFTFNITFCFNLDYQGVFMEKPVIVSIVNNKGGVGKTSTVINLAAGLTQQNKQVLVVDLDGQMNLTHSLIGDLPENTLTICEAMIKDKIALTDIIQTTSIPHLDIIPSGEMMFHLEMPSPSALNKTDRLKKILKSSEVDKYDFILIDNAPHIGLATINSLIASHFFLVPVTPDYLPLLGLRNLLNNIDQVKTIHAEIRNLGYLLTMVDRREKISTDIEKILRETFENEVFETVVRINTKFKVCPQKRKSIFEIENQKGKGYMDYLNVTQEFLKRLENMYVH